MHSQNAVKWLSMYRSFHPSISHLVHLHPSLHGSLLVAGFSSSLLEYICGVVSELDRFW